MLVYVTVGYTKDDERVQVLYAGDDADIAHMRGDQWITVDHPSGHYMVEMWANGGLRGGAGRHGRKCSP